MAKTIADYKKDYETARAAGDAAGMQAANNGANAIRESQGVAKEYATSDINKIAEQNKTTPTNLSNNTSSGGGGSNRGGRGTTSSVANVSASTAAQQNIINQMAANSTAWHTASAAEKKTLEAQNQNLAAQLSALGMNMTFNSTTGMWSGSGTTTTAPTVNSVTNPSLNGISLGDVYGLTYDYDKILSLLNQATQDSYAVKEQEARQNENMFYRNLIDTQSTTLDTLRQAQAAAVATGASRGIAAANELSAILGLQDTSVEGATELANARTNLSSEQQAEMSKNASSALDTSNAIKQAVAGLDLTKYGYDVQGLIGQLDYLAALYNSDSTLEGVKYNADTNLAGTKYAADNQPVYSGSSYSNNSSGGGYSNNSSGSGSTNTGTGNMNTGSTNTGGTNNSVQSATGGSISAKTLDDSIASGGGSATLTGTPFLVARNDDGTYRLTDGSNNENSSVSSLTWQQVARVQNNNDLNAWRPNYGISGFTSALEKTGKKLTVGSTTYTYSSDGLWYSGAVGKVYTPQQISELSTGSNEDTLALWRSLGMTIVNNADGTYTVYSKGATATPGKSTADLITSVRAGSLQSGALYTIGGTKYSYDASAGLWINQSTKAKVTVPAFNNLVANSSTFGV